MRKKSMSILLSNWLFSVHLIYFFEWFITFCAYLCFIYAFLPFCWLLDVFDITICCFLSSCFNLMTFPNIHEQFCTFSSTDNQPSRPCCLCKKHENKGEIWPPLVVPDTRGKRKGHKARLASFQRFTIGHRERFHRWRKYGHQ